MSGTVTMTSTANHEAQDLEEKESRSLRESIRSRVLNFTPSWFSVK